jgi:hypothetical protein
VNLIAAEPVPEQVQGRRGRSGSSRPRTVMRPLFWRA